jgi:hypothetical protein
MARGPLSPDSKASFAAKLAMSKGKTPEARAAGEAKYKEFQAAQKAKQDSANKIATSSARKQSANSARGASRPSTRIRTTDTPTTPSKNIGPSRSSMSLILPTGLQIKTPTAPRTVGGIDGAGGTNVTPIHKPTGGTNF